MTINDSGQQNRRHIDREAIRCRQRTDYRVGKAIAFVAPVLIPILNSRVTLWIGVAIYVPFALVREFFRSARGLAGCQA